MVSPLLIRNENFLLGFMATIFTAKAIEILEASTYAYTSKQNMALNLHSILESLISKNHLSYLIITYNQDYRPSDQTTRFKFILMKIYSIKDSKF